MREFDAAKSLEDGLLKDEAAQRSEIFRNGSSNSTQAMARFAAATAARKAAAAWRSGAAARASEN
jgi:hypothetical protein